MHHYSFLLESKLQDLVISENCCDLARSAVPLGQYKLRRFVRTGKKVPSVKVCYGSSDVIKAK